MIFMYGRANSTGLTFKSLYQKVLSTEESTLIQPFLVICVFETGSLVVHIIELGRPRVARTPNQEDTFYRLLNKIGVLALDLTLAYDVLSEMIRVWREIPGTRLRQWSSFLNQTIASPSSNMAEILNPLSFLVGY
ncbi:hypothetical protein J6590_103281 [Homalodisca vitripennis]|nr:hypothetical protein J6590_103281 [Homalodisca vitripennis]